MATDQPPETPARLVYVVTSGEYSDYGIRAIFSDRAKAEAFAVEFNKTNSYNGAGVDEWVLDEQADARCQISYRLRLRIVAGSLVEDSRGTTQELRPQGWRGFAHVSVFPGGIYIFGVSPISFDHAHKLSVEAWQEHQAKKAVLP